MCGIAGIFYLENQEKVEPAMFNRMTDSLSHRGPDDRGTFIDRNLGLGFCRLSVIDLSPSGHQPMFNEDGSVCLVCNGEIYNFQDLKSVLEKKGHRFKSRTDIEVIMHAYEEYGTDCLEHLDGMFAFAIWDSRKRQLFLARDRFGIKPLYYYHKDGIFAFGSEIKALLCIPRISREIDNQALWNYFSLKQIPAPQTIYKDIRKFLPSQAMVIKERGIRKEWQYWDIRIEEDHSKSENEWVEELKALFEDSIKTHLVADVPVGCLLSGGIDSSAIVAFLASVKQEPIKTYSVSFNDGGGFDESGMQRLVVDRFKTDHHEIKVGADILQAVHLLTQECDEPFAEPSAIALYYLSKLASEKVKVVLSGDGGDELFAGYVPRYDREMLFNRVSSVPFFPKKVLKDISRTIPSKLDNVSFFRKLKRLLQFSSMNDYERYMHTSSIYSTEEKMSLFSRDFLATIDKDVISGCYLKEVTGFNVTNLNKRLYYDIKTGLADEMLTKMDRCTSMVGIEGRVPFLDRKFAECSMKVPVSLKYSQNNGKKIFKRLLKDVVPDEILSRKKQGFSVPIGNWSLENIEEPDYCNSSIFNTDYIQDLKRRYVKGDRRLAHHLWIVRCFSVWENLYK